MDVTSPSSPIFQRLRFILVGTSHPGNIGAAARAMKTMGFADLILVNPRFEDALTQPEAIAFASGAQNILANARIVSSVEEAQAGCHFVAAVSARLREFSPPVWEPRALAAHVVHELPHNVALVFGNERFGLPNEIVVNCNALINIPANPDYSSLNLAQAVQVLAYECRVAALDNTVAPTTIGFKGDLASNQEIDGMYEHLERALLAIEFLDARQPKKLMPRLKRLFSRAQLEQEEVNILRGVAKKIIDSKSG